MNCSVAWRSAPTLILTCLLVCGCGPNRHPSSGNASESGPRYYGLAGQSVGVMVWADRGVLIDFPTIQLDLANAVQTRVRQSKSGDLRDATWPVLPASIVRYQREHPGIEYKPITEVAPRIGVSRLIYIEVGRFSTRSEASLQMFRGNAIAMLRVVEVNGDDARVAYELPNITAYYPPHSPKEGVMNSDDLRIYKGTVAALADAIAARLAERTRS